MRQILIRFVSFHSFRYETTRLVVGVVVVLVGVVVLVVVVVVVGVVVVLRIFTITTD